MTSAMIHRKQLIEVGDQVEASYTVTERIGRHTVKYDRIVQGQVDLIEQITPTVHRVWIRQTTTRLSWCADTRVCMIEAL